MSVSSQHNADSIVTISLYNLSDLYAFWRAECQTRRVD